MRSHLLLELGASLINALKRKQLSVVFIGHGSEK